MDVELRFYARNHGVRYLSSSLSVATTAARDDGLPSLSRSSRSMSPSATHPSAVAHQSSGSSRDAADPSAPGSALRAGPSGCRRYKWHVIILSLVVAATFFLLMALVKTGK